LCWCGRREVSINPMVGLNLSNSKSKLKSNSLGYVCCMCVRIGRKGFSFGVEAETEYMRPVYLHGSFLANGASI
jgi:hypothetical protein